MEIFKKYKLLLPLVICCLAVLAMGLFLLLYDGGGAGKDTETDTETETEEDIKVEVPAFISDLSAYEAYMDVPQGTFLTLVNKRSPVGEDYDPGELCSVADARKEVELQKNAAMAMEAMFIELRAAGFTGVFVTSGYRSYSYQHWLFYDKYIPEEMAADPAIDREEAERRVLAYSAKPGTSEHHTGLAADLMIDGMTELDESFADYPVYEWLQANAWKFGFILRFPEDKTDITGYDYEPWHYRFVGRYDAYMMHKDGLCLEEYIAGQS